jgi:hypothetical protein
MGSMHARIAANEMQNENADLSGVHVNEYVNLAVNAASTVVQSTERFSPEERMNAACFCLSLDEHALGSALEDQLGSAELVALVRERCPFLFSAMPVFVSDGHRQKMEETVHAIESVIALPAYRERILARSPAIAQHDGAGAQGVFCGYDFHLGPETVGLIEINTNAGGAMLNAVMARAHRTCCIDTGQLADAAASGPQFERTIVEMFRTEWDRCKPGKLLRSIAIVDVLPHEQYLYAEFLLFQQLFERHGVRAIIADPSALVYRDGVLWHDGETVDLVYNRLTDFMLDDVGNSQLRQAYLDNAVVLTPNPRVYALYADKRNLAILSSRDELELLGVPAQIQKVLLGAVLPTELVDPAHDSRLWERRRGLFFKPTSGYGGRAAYRGDKVTKRVWQDIIKGDYVAQQLMTPAGRATGSVEAPGMLKFDVRLYTYAGEVQWTTARVYQGQTTNFRTPGGGFAPVYQLPANSTTCGSACLAGAPMRGAGIG